MLHLAPGACGVEKCVEGDGGGSAIEGGPSTGRPRNVGVSFGAMHCRHRCPRSNTGGHASAVSCLINQK